jgi:hypothetical protein
MDWMDKKNLCFLSCAGLGDHGTHKRQKFDHAVDPFINSDTSADGIIVCEYCAERCECCDDIEPALYDYDDVDCPHDTVCSSCFRRQGKCEHKDDEDAWPDYCTGCERGCRASDERTIGGVLKDICERCDPDA